MNIDIGKVLSTCLDYIKQNPVILAPQLAVGVLSFVLTLLILGTANAGFVPVRGMDIAAILGAFALFALIMAVASLIAWGLSASMAADVVESGSTSLGSGFSRFASKLGPILVVEILGGIIVAIGLVLCILPGIAAAFFLMFSLAAVVYGNMGPIEAIQASLATVKNNLVDALVIAGIAIGLSIAGGIASSILGFIPVLGGLLGSLITGATTTFVLILTVEAYKQITGEAQVSQSTL